MTTLTRLAINHDLPNEILHFMSTKIARRLFKLSSSASPELSHMINEVTGEVRGILEERWESVQDAQEASPPWNPETLRVLQDTRLSLNNSREYVHHALYNQHSSPPSTSFKPSHHVRGTIDDFLDTNASFLAAAHTAEPSLALADFETVIRLGIDDWVARVASRTAETACISIEACACAYSSRALKSYKGNPENLSIMLVTLFDLWVAMDKIVVGQIPLLADYSPEIPLSLLERLLIRKFSALDRVKRLHAYLKARHRGTLSHPSVFSSTTNDKSFAVRYFHQSSKLKSLKLYIEVDAERERMEKKKELQTLNKQYAALQRRAENSTHVNGIDSRGWEYHMEYCLAATNPRTGRDGRGV
ncbi:hypothetical protein AZE42_09441 [Rhizopogon vesiculosus]|uniref:Uncharacterized protein n=1 Tax=Rhizopogon vesiculosus TaxID=180088 RepID=A0A1J8PMG2_9AGAM|nr:hypothetical protein AZE42_09441 [Rhizopogon vesiculosus]